MDKIKWSTVAVVRTDRDPVGAKHLQFRRDTHVEDACNRVGAALRKSGSAIVSFEEPEQLAEFNSVFLPRLDPTIDCDALIPFAILEELEVQP